MKRIFLAFLALPLLAAGPGKPDDAGAAASEADCYSFAPGDTFYSLARWARVPLRALIAANPGIDPRHIEIGDRVRLPDGAADPAPMRFREWGDGPGPAWRAASRARFDPPPRPRFEPAPPDPRFEAPLPPPREAAPPPRRPLPDSDKPEDQPEGM